jgi:hypothetical protein
MAGYYDDPEIKKLFDETYPGMDAGAVWTQQNAANNPPPAPTINPPTSSYVSPGVFTPVTPQISQPVAPQVSQPVTPTVTQSTDSGAAPWKPYAPSATLSGPAAPMPAQPVPAGLTPAEQAAADVQNRNAAEQARANAVAEKLRQDQFDLEKAKSEAMNAYNQSLLQFNDKQLAQQAFDNSLLAAYRSRQNEIAAEGQQAQTNYWGQQIALQQGQQRVALRQRKPFRSARIRMA